MMRSFWLGSIAAFALSTTGMAADQLVILSPHRKSIQDEFVPKFKEWYKKTYQTDVTVDWLDQGGTSDDVRFLRAKFAANPKTAGVDLFWGGGYSAYSDLEDEKFFAPFDLPADLKKEIPAEAAGVPLFPKSQSFYGTALSSFGVFYNKKILAMDKLPEVKTWADIADPKYYDQLSLTDVRRSGSNATMDMLVMQNAGWEKGWELLTRIAGNTRAFTHSSSDPIKAVVAGDAAAAMAIDFYALAKIGDLGKDNLGFVLPQGQTILDPDPIAIIRGAPNRRTAERFVTYILSAPAQKLLVLPKGQADGPTTASQGRMAVNTKAYAETEGRRIIDHNPFKEKSSFKMDVAKASRLTRVFNDLVGAVHIDTHKELKAAWNALIKRGLPEAEVREFLTPPVSEKELLALAAKWDDEVFRNKQINAWVEAAKAKYAKVQKKS